MLINIKYNGKDDMPYIMENKKNCLKSPTRMESHKSHVPNHQSDTQFV